MAVYSNFLKFRAAKMKLFAVVIVFLGISTVSYLLAEMWKSQNEEKINFIPQPWNMTFEYVVVHFDLKGAPPLLTYLQSTLKTLKERGANALLIEYEDMFPYEGTLINLTAGNHYDSNELKQFLMSVDQMGLEVIPLVQTFGHLEFALKLREFQHLREDPKFPDSICPNKKESQEFLREMLRQVIKFHSKVAPLKHIHVGCNEVHQIKVCELCSKKESSKMGIILNHIKFINDVIEDLSPKTRILVWDDMLRHIQSAESFNLKLPNIESVTWDYSTDTYYYISLHPVFQKHQRIFENMWVASAYKGADGPTRTIPILKNRFQNLLNWLNFILIHDCYHHHYHFKGIILTGRSRYSHMEPPCELLPVAMPSLLLNLILIQKFHNGIASIQLSSKLRTEEDSEIEQQRYISYFIVDDLNAALMCQNSMTDGYLESFQAITCIFEGSDLYVMLSSCSEAKFIFTKIHTDCYDTNFTSEASMDDMKLGYVKMIDVKRLMDTSVSTMQQLLILESQMVDSMTPYFDKYVIEEYITLKTSRMKKNVHDFLQYLSDFYIVKDWPRRYTSSNSFTSASWQRKVEKEIQIV